MVLDELQVVPQDAHVLHLVGTVCEILLGVRAAVEFSKEFAIRLS